MIYNREDLEKMFAGNWWSFKNCMVLDFDDGFQISYFEDTKSFMIIFDNRTFKTTSSIEEVKKYYNKQIMKLNFK